MSKNQNILAAANAVEPWDLGASPDGFAPESAPAMSAARRPTSDASGDFVPNEPSNPVGQPENAPTPQRTTRPAHSFRDVEHQRAVAGGHEILPAPETDDSHRHPFLKKVLKSPAVKAALVSAKAEQKSFREVCGSTEKIIGKERQAAELLRAIESCTDVAKLESLRAQYAETQGPAAEAARQSANRIVRHAFIKLESAIQTLLDAVTTELDALVPEIEFAEMELFKSFGFPHEQTPLAGKLKGIKARVHHHRQSLALMNSPERVNSVTPGDCQQIFETFAA